MSIFSDLLAKTKLAEVNEMSVAMSGDYDFGNLNYIKNGSRILSKVDNNYSKYLLSEPFKGELLHLIKINVKRGGSFYVLCRDYLDSDKDEKGNTYKTTNRYQMIAAMHLSEEKSYRGYDKRIRVVKGVEVHDEERLKGYGTFFYKLLINNLDIHLMGDVEQYEGARKLWINLSQNPTFKVDIVNLSAGVKIIHTDVILKDALDERIWTDEKLMLSGTKEEKYRGRFARLILSKVE